MSGSAPKIIIIAGPNRAGKTTLHNFKHHYRNAVNDWALYDNAGQAPVLLEWGENP